METPNYGEDRPPGHRGSRALSRARSFYQSLGLSVLDEEEGEEGVRSAMIPLGDSRLRLMEPLDSATELGKFLQQHGEGLYHLALPRG